MKNANLLIRKRIATLSLLFTISFTLLGSRLFWVQFVNGEILAEQAQDMRMRDIPVEAKRGIIYDRNGRELALSVSVDSVYANPSEIKAGDPENTAKQLAPVLEMGENVILQKITQNSGFVWLKRQIGTDESQKIKDLNIKGIGLTEESRREYPKGSLASHILGIAGMDNVGLEGIDFYYNDLVGGEPGRIIIEKDAKNRDIPEAVHDYIAPLEGSDLVLTIDETIQFIAERELDKMMEERKPKKATAIVMDPVTGEILALASRPNFDPLTFTDFPDENRRNFAINDIYEPGSTMKIMTSAMALEEKTVNQDSRFYCPGFIKVGSKIITCADNKAHGSQTFAQILENSCNVGFVQVGQSLGKDKYYQYLNDFGFGQTTGIDLPGEASGMLRDSQEATILDLSTMAMGQTNAITAIQLITAVSAVANEGKLMKPHLLKEVRDHNGNVINSVEPQVVRQVISPDTAMELSLMLEGEVINGTGKNAYIEGYHVGGKTGTAQKIKPGGGYLPDEYIVSFIGYGPVQNPRLVCAVIVDAPQGYPYYGSWVAAPVFKAIMLDSFHYLNEPMHKTDPDKQTIEDDQLLVPDVVNFPIDEAVAAIKGRGFNVKISGSGDLVWQQTPKPLVKLHKGSEVVLSLSPASQITQGQVTIPDLQGKSMKEVAKILSDLQLHLAPEGYGLSYEQTPAPGVVVSTGSSITVRFRAVDN
ncbi:MAG: stage V sporulation protein D [Syntrophomonadaceae bacterium]|jgi:stage V sporulation protein D (sporulation-specific penicillin-binding protein)|nr:stage V sporulation protein D [Syntrophomonadaceae bacterium]